MASPESDQARWFAEEVQPHGAQLKAYLRGSFPSVGEVDDIVQESYLRIWKARAGQPIRSARAFLYQIARHLALDRLRHRRISPITAVPDLSVLPVLEERPGATETACRNEEIALLAEALDALPPRCREIIILRKFQHLPQNEVARRLGIAPETVQEQVYRGLHRCERFLVARGVMSAWHHD